MSGVVYFLFTTIHVHVHYNVYMCFGGLISRTLANDIKKAELAGN